MPAPVIRETVQVVRVRARWGPQDGIGGWGGDALPWLRRDHGQVGEYPEVPLPGPTWRTSRALVGYGGDHVPWLHRDHGQAGEVVGDAVVGHWSSRHSTTGYGGDHIPWLKRDHGQAGEIVRDAAAVHWAPSEQVVGYGGDFIAWLKRDHGDSGTTIGDAVVELWQPILVTVGWGGDALSWVKRDHGTPGELIGDAVAVKWGPDNTTGGWGGDFTVWARHDLGKIDLVADDKVDRRTPTFAGVHQTSWLKRDRGQTGELVGEVEVNRRPTTTQTGGYGGDFVPWLKRDHGDPGVLVGDVVVTHWSPTLVVYTPVISGDYIPWLKRDHGQAGEVVGDALASKWQPYYVTAGWGGDFIAWAKRDHGQAGEWPELPTQPRAWGPVQTTGGGGGELLAWTKHNLGKIVEQVDEPSYRQLPTFDSRDHLSWQKRDRGTVNELTVDVIANRCTSLLTTSSTLTDQSPWLKRDHGAPGEAAGDALVNRWSPVLVVHVQPIVIEQLPWLKRDHGQAGELIGDAVIGRRPASIFPSPVYITSIVVVKLNQGIPYTIVREWNGSWTFTWTGTPPYRVVLCGVELATTAVGYYNYNRVGFTVTPPPLEIYPVGQIAQTEIFSPYIPIQWYSIGTPEYDIDHYQDGNWAPVGNIPDNGQWVFDYKTAPIADGTNAQYRVTGVSGLDSGAPEVYQQIIVTCPTPIPTTVVFTTNIIVSLG